jgi:hypothetical protein
MGSIWGVAHRRGVRPDVTSYLDNYQPWGYQLNDLYMYIGALLDHHDDLPAGRLLPSRRRKREFTTRDLRGITSTNGGHLDETRPLRGDQKRERRPAPSWSSTCENVTLRFGGVVSLRDVSLEMRRGEILAVIGPERRRQDVALQLPDRRLRTPRGTTSTSRSHGATISVIGKKTHRIARAGVSRTFQASRLFSALTVFENVKIGAEITGASASWAHS